VKDLLRRDEALPLENRQHCIDGGEFRALPEIGDRNEGGRPNDVQEIGAARCPAAQLFQPFIGQGRPGTDLPLCRLGEPVRERGLEDVPGGAM